MEFSLYSRQGDVLVEGVLQFKYLGRPMDQTDENCPAVWQNVKWVRKVWGGLGKIM